MRCEECGRPIKNAQMWQLGADPRAPQTRSLRQLCLSCLEHPNAEPHSADFHAVPGIVAEATEVARNYQEPRA